MERTLIDKNVRMGLGVLTGLVGLVAMVRLVVGAFGGSVSTIAWFFILCAMVPWVGYAAWRARHSHLRGRSAVAVLALGVAGLLIVWLSTLGPVTALLFSLAAFVIIWIHDWPPRRTRSEDRYVRIEDLTAEEPVGDAAP